MRTINHFGVVTQTPQPGEFYVESLKVWLTDFSKSPNHIEFLRFEEGSCMPEIIQTTAHIAYEVESLKEALVNANVLVEPFVGGEKLMCAFIEEEGIAIELMEFEK